MKLFDHKDSVNQHFKTFEDLNVTIDIKREDLLHKEVSGNKLRKLRYNLKAALDQEYSQVLTYGGAYSNHIAATAAACRIVGLSSIGIIRGEELGDTLEKTLATNQTLRTAHKNGMQLKFVSRKEYREKMEVDFQAQLMLDYGVFYNIPEGGTNALAVKGANEILTSKDLESYDVICVAGGTGGTAAGIINSVNEGHQVFVFSALKGDFLRRDIEKFSSDRSFELVGENHFGGYVRSNDALIDYMNVRFRESGIPLDPIYTGKMMYRLEQMIQQGIFNGKTRILAIHTGGLQGIPGYNQMLKKKGRLQLQYEDHI
ncbi:1-aminocyclopropane-1-carboxylate deaminase/D-cysteine desulfhydrase [Nonlabens marinus]|uniref:1-aminocyclopropane-1-carboxylate deaminase n=1 Tax=Nonlabens marinus S1-08 TaxID=1454201 RepID=W8VVQ7_9FLAO|nr:pyridoxal-phosphate dependent enzyme [Nonlabens marinus]BAO55663.1 1-aminocyclopropane-1-carboxylate deaminase [Nonlabens marinus S1-08]